MNTIKENNIYCGFCLKTHANLKKENQILHVGLDTFICEGCVETIVHIKSKRFKASELGKKISSLGIS